VHLRAERRIGAEALVLAEQARVAVEPTVVRTAWGRATAPVDAESDVEEDYDEEESGYDRDGYRNVQILRIKSLGVAKR
jgi:hypothetical protein